MQGKSITKLVILITAVVLIIYDICIDYLFNAEATLSAISWDWAYKYPIYPMAFGYLMAHLFFVDTGFAAVDVLRDKVFSYFQKFPSAALGLGVVLMLIPWPHSTFLTFTVGLVAGYLTWKQHEPVPPAILPPSNLTSNPTPPDPTPTDPSPSP